MSMVETSWPPKSPRDALLSSPGGRRCYEEMQRRRENPGSPRKRTTVTPKSQSKANCLLTDGVEENEDEEEDEEMLQLKLAAIEARLKLKQLQKNRGRSADEDDIPPRPVSARSQDQAAPRPRAFSPPAKKDRPQSDEVQVPISPIKRSTAAVEPASPRRYLLGIDKGLRSTEVSLKRPPSAKAGNRPPSRLGNREGAMSRTGDIFASRPQSSSSAVGDGIKRGSKSFSERIAESRTVEKSRKERSERAERIQANRSSGFQLNAAEVEGFKAKAAEAPPPRSPVRGRQVENFSRDDVLRSYHNPNPPGLKRSQTAPSGRKYDQDVNPKEPRPYLHKRSNKSESESQSFSSQPPGSQDTIPDENYADTEDSLERPPDSSKFEAYSSQHLSNRILPHSFLSRTLSDKKVLRIPDLLRTVKAPDFELPEDIDGDFVVFGIVASKSEPKQTKESKNITKDIDPFDDGLNNTNRYMVITLTDLKWSIDLFLFDTAFPRYYRLSEGILIAILNPTIMPPPKNKTDTNRFSLVISSSDDKVLEVGFSQDIGFCKAVRKDGKTCQSWVDGRKTEFCDFHVDLQVRRTQGQRMGVNNGTGMLGPGGGSGPRTGFFGGGGKKPNNQKNGLKPDGARYDMSSQSLYYVAPGRKSGNGGGSFHPGLPGQSAAGLIDADEDDPFIAAGMMGRGMENKEERLRKRLADQQRERDITQKLITFRGGGVGADYLRAGAGTPSNANKNQENTKPETPSTASSLGLTGFRKAAAVKLSPLKRSFNKPHGSGVKKTRFITARGIKEAGRDSLGGPSSDALAKAGNNDDDDDDDDELDIV